MSDVFLCIICELLIQMLNYTLHQKNNNKTIILQSTKYFSIMWTKIKIKESDIKHLLFPNESRAINLSVWDTWSLPFESALFIFKHNINRLYSIYVLNVVVALFGCLHDAIAMPVWNQRLTHMLCVRDNTKVYLHCVFQVFS